MVIFTRMSSESIVGRQRITDKILIQCSTPMFMYDTVTDASSADAYNVIFSIDIFDDRI